MFASLKEWVLSLGDMGSVRYIYDDNALLYVDRLSPSNEVMYRHSYVYNEQGVLIREDLIGNLGTLTHEKPGIVTSPYHLEICEYDTQGNVIRHVQDDLVREYSYNEHELITENVSEEICEYDASGNLIRKGDSYFSYDDANRLINVLSDECDIHYIYDEQGRRVARVSNGEKESYAHFGTNEIAVFDDSDNLKELRIPGFSYHKDLIRPIAIETPEAIYAPIHDVQNNIVKLIDIETREVISLSLCDPFGKGLSKTAPTRWIFAGKPYDKEANLIYFGQRYYSPDLHQWLSRDPARQSSNPYQYCLNNPLKYFDPDGCFAFVIPIIGFSIKALVTATAYASAAAITAWSAYKIEKALQEKEENQRYKEWQESQKEKKPPYEGKELGEDPTKCPGECFKWKGKGAPGSRQGNWVRGEGKSREILHPDLNHPDPIAPHWDYTGPEFPRGARLYLDNSWELKR